MSYISLKNVCKTYKSGEITINASDNVSFDIEQGEFTIITGESGAGKTTILNLLGGMDRADSGSVTVDGTDIAALSHRKLTAYRRNDVGFVFQFYNLVPNLTARENVELATEITKSSTAPGDVLDMVGLSDRQGNFPSQLSGGEQQRVSIARAVAKSPKLLLCDEPTGALDYNTGRTILKLLQDCCRKKGMTVVVVTHNQAITPMADRVICMKNGKVAKIMLNPNPTSVEDIEW